MSKRIGPQCRWLTFTYGTLYLSSCTDRLVLVTVESEGGVRHLVGSWIIKHNLNCAVTRPMSICFLNMLKIHFRWIPHHADDGSATSWTRAFHAHHCLLLNSQSTVITILQVAAGKLFRIIIFYHHPSSFTVMASPEGVLCPAANSSHFFVMNGIVSLNVPQLLHCIQIDRFYRCRGTI